MSKISYSQYAMWRACPHKWKLTYVDKAAPFRENMNFLFGTAMHHVLQEYLKLMYSDSIKAADELDLKKMLFEKMKELYLESKLEEGFVEYSSKELMAEFYIDGVNIIDYFKRNRDSYFHKKGYKLIGVEVPLNTKVTENISFTGFLDVVVKDEFSGRIQIYDFKTSSMGWRDAQKKDESKTAQLILYKHYFSQQYNIPADMIDVMFIILKRKLFENSEFPQKRFQKVEPASGKVSTKKILAGMQEFIDSCFDSDGNILTKDQPKYPSKKACQYCEFKDLPKLCDRKP